MSQPVPMTAATIRTLAFAEYDFVTIDADLGTLTDRGADALVRLPHLLTPLRGRRLPDGRVTYWPRGRWENATE